jgi:hypothetical protein
VREEKSIEARLTSDAAEDAMARPDDFCVLYEWHAGSMPPPYHYEYVIRVEADLRGELVFSPDYPRYDPKMWTKTFTVDEGIVDRLHELMVEKGLFREDCTRMEHAPVGGTLEWLEVTADGKSIKVPPDIGDPAEVTQIYAAVRSVVPAGIWAELEWRCKRARMRGPILSAIWWSIHLARKATRLLGAFVPGSKSARRSRPTCNCVTAPLDDQEFRSKHVGVDVTEGRHGDVSIDRCRACGRRWLVYHFEHEGFSKSGRWYRGVISRSEARSVTPEMAVDLLEGLDWYLRGGSYFASKGKRASGKLDFSL